MYFYLYHDLYFIYVLFVCFYEITVFDYFAQTHNVVVILVVFTIPKKLLFSWPFWVNLDSYIAPGLRDLARWSIFKLLPPLSLIYTQQLKLKLFPCLKYIIQSVPSWRLLFCYFLEHTKNGVNRFATWIKKYAYAWICWIRFSHRNHLRLKLCNILRPKEA